MGEPMYYEYICKASVAYNLQDVPLFAVVQGLFGTIRYSYFKELEENEKKKENAKYMDAKNNLIDYFLFFFGPK